MHSNDLQLCPTNDMLENWTDFRMSETAVVECQRCGQQCTRGFSKGEEDQDFQNLLVHEMVVHNSTMPELAHVFRTQDASESKELLDKAIKQAPTHQKACIIAQSCKKCFLVPQAASLWWGFLKGKSKESQVCSVLFSRGSASTLAMLATFYNSDAGP